MKFLVVLFLSLQITLPLFAQVDTIHYLPPLFARADAGDHYLILATDEVDPIRVDVFDGAGNLLTTRTVSTSNSDTYFLGSGLISPMLIQESDLATVVSGKGLILKSAKLFNASVRIIAGSQAGTITSKGQAALGTEFRSGHLLGSTGGTNLKSHIISVMASENFTKVEIDDISSGVVFENVTASGVPLTTDSGSFMLNAGESIVFAAFFDASAENRDLVNGTLIKSDKPVAVNSGSWLGGGAPSAIARDMGIDQIVPIYNMGTEYVLVKGAGTNSNRDAPIVVAHEDNTKVMLWNGSMMTTVTTLNAGDFYIVPYSAWSIDNNLFIQTSKKAYIYHAVSSLDTDSSSSLNFIPTTSCLADKGTEIGNFLMNNGSSDLFTSGKVTLIAELGSQVFLDGILQSVAQAVPGTSNWETYNLTGLGGGDHILSSGGAQGISAIWSGTTSGAAGFFTGFGNYPKITDIQGDGISRTELACSVEYMEASSGFDAYQWYLNGQMLSGETGIILKNFSDGAYSVTGYRGGLCDQTSDLSATFVVPGDYSTRLGSVSIKQESPECPEAPVVDVEVIIANESSQTTLSDNLPFSFYVGNPATSEATYLFTDYTTSAIPPKGQITLSYSFDLAMLPGALPKDIHWILNDDGSKIPPIKYLDDLPIYSLGPLECNYLNNNATTGLFDCQTDSDGDGIFDLFDNCKNIFNPSQSDIDKDGEGDLCDLFECTDLQPVQIKIDGSFYALHKQTTRLLKIRKRLAHKNYCAQLSVTKQGSLKEQSQNSYIAAWSAIWSLPRIDYNNCVDLANCTKLSNRSVKNTLTVETEKLKSLNQRLLKSACLKNAAGKKIKRLQRRISSLSTNVEANLAEYPDMRLFCE